MKNIALFLIAVTLTGCGLQNVMQWKSDRHHATSIVDYLYPDQAERVETEGVPAVLTVPMRVGVAFVPDRSSEHGAQGDLTEKEKLALLREIGDDFKKYPFIKSIDTIPSAYLTPQGSFANLDQMRTMFGTDVIALVSYDQVQFTDEGLLSLSYWTLVGAYVAKGEKNDTQTMVDLAVYHVPTRKMLFRAPGLSRVRATATPINLQEQLRADRSTGFTDASKDLVANLHGELEEFQERVKAEPEEFRIQSKAGSTGGGSIDGLTLILLAGAGGYWVVARKRGWSR
jgi:rhombotail lipoprotein